MTVPSFRSYGEYASGNYGVNAMAFYLPNGVSFYYSYSTLVGFNSPFSGLVVMKNYWSTTTGKHLNWISPDKTIRKSQDEFKEELDKMLKHYGLTESE